MDTVLSHAVDNLFLTRKSMSKKFESTEIRTAYFQFFTEFNFLKVLTNIWVP